MKLTNCDQVYKYQLSPEIILSEVNSSSAKTGIVMSNLHKFTTSCHNFFLNMKTKNPVTFVVVFSKNVRNGQTHMLPINNVVHYLPFQCVSLSMISSYTIIRESIYPLSNFILPVTSSQIIKTFLDGSKLEGFYQCLDEHDWSLHWSNTNIYMQINMLTKLTSVTKHFHISTKPGSNVVMYICINQSMFTTHFFPSE